MTKYIVVAFKVPIFGCVECPKKLRICYVTKLNVGLGGVSSVIRPNEFPRLLSFGLTGIGNLRPSDLNMPGLVRKFMVFAAVDGLVLQPVAQRNQRATPALRIAYSSHDITALASDPRKDASSASFDAHGIVGTRPFNY